MQKHQKIEVKQSARLTVFLAGLHGVAALGVMQLPLQTWSYLCAMGVLIIVAIFHGCIYLGKKRVTAFRIVGEKIQIFQSGRMREMPLANRHFESAYLILLGFRSRCFGLGSGLALFPDALDKDQYRQLRARLRFPVEPH